MKHYRVSKDAETDLDEIFAYWAERASVDIADRLIDAIVERFWDWRVPCRWPGM
jgi:plasmid stabilization system protein ParE